MFFEPDFQSSPSNSERHKQALKKQKKKDKALRKSKKVRFDPFDRRPLGVDEVMFDGRKR